MPTTRPAPRRSSPAHSTQRCSRYRAPRHRRDRAEWRGRNAVTCRPGNRRESDRVRSRRRPAAGSGTRGRVRRSVRDAPHRCLPRLRPSHEAQPGRSDAATSLGPSGGEAQRPVAIGPPQRRDHLGTGAHVDDGLVRRKQLGQAGPGVADDGRAACGGLEQPHAGRPAGGDHVGARHSEREELPVAEVWMLRRRQVGNAVDIGRPVDVVGIARPSDDEPACGQSPGGLEQETFQGGKGTGV